ncbi:MAG: ferritin-like domain-containing protein [Alphaproteobacteria bacterium]
MKHWTLDDIPWQRFEPARVDQDMLAVVKAAGMVERNGADYAVYLCNVFHDDPEFQRAAREWADEEVQHGEALARWAELADPEFDFQAAFKRFTDGYRLPLEARQSVRGSLSGELVARCVVESGTSSYYTALAEAAEEPVLKAICKRIAADELRHYKLFYTHLKRYLEKERLGTWARLRVALGRLIETEDDELAYAYFAANGGGAYDRRRYGQAYVRRAYGFYRPWHVERGIAMIFKVVGLKPHGRLNLALARLVYRFMRRRSRRLAAAGA